MPGAGGHHQASVPARHGPGAAPSDAAPGTPALPPAGEPPGAGNSAPGTPALPPAVQGTGAAQTKGPESPVGGLAACMAHARGLLAGYLEVLFLHSPALGLAFFAVLLLSPNVAAAGVLAVLSAYGFARLVHMGEDLAVSGPYVYNPLLVGLSLGYLYRLTPLTALLIATGAVLALVVTALLDHVFRGYLKLPVLSLPFALVSSAAYLATSSYSSLLETSPQPAGLLGAWQPDLPFWLEGFFRSFGALFFAPGIVTGMLFGILILCTSRILFLLAAMGYFVGACVRGLMLGSMSQAFGDLNSFNFILTAMAVGGAFLVPSLRSYLLAAIAVVLSTLTLDALAVLGSPYGIPVFTLPFVVASLGMLYLLGLLRHPLLALHPGRTPEETLETHACNRLRYPGEQRTLRPPFAGKWTVWQGDRPGWTHGGTWAHALDFVIADDEGKAHWADGARLEDHYCYRKPVLSPVRGYVMQVVSHLPDNAPGSVDPANPWGNLVVIWDPRGFYVALSHFSPGTASVKKGDWVEAGAPLGLCGSSGYSPQPHLHVQAQGGESAGGASLPFSFTSYIAGARYHANDRPRQGETVEPIHADQRLDLLTTFLIGEEQEYRVFRDKQERGRWLLKTGMTPEGALYLGTERGRLYFGKHEGTLYFYRVDGDDEWLRRLFLALPRLPLAYRDQLVWVDYVPIGVAASGLPRVLGRLLSALDPRFATAQVTQVYVGRDRVRSTIEAPALGVHRTAEVELDARKGFARVRVDSMELRKVDTAGTSG